jgi:DNA polymerase-3 subunit gamma/tau
MADNHYLVLARKWRPQSFEDVVGQEHITKTLQNAINSGRIGHAFLFIGSRGIGKTTTARILAKALNCTAGDGPAPNPCDQCENCRSISAGNNIDVLEIDGASNNSVEDVRQIREYVRLVPSGSRYKIYVIDEVHQLSISAFNALLKTLEEPPAHAVFILATTDAHKIPATIVSRCQRYDFRRVGLDTVMALLRHILEAEGVTCADEALHAIARAADGGVRDAESILEQLISYCGKEISFQDVFDVLGLIDYRVLHELCEAILDKNIGKQLAIVEDVVVSGKDLSQFVGDILQYFRNLLVCKTADASNLLAMPAEEIDALRAIADRFTLTELIKLVEQVAELSKSFDSQLAQRIALEALLIRISKVAVEMSVDTVLEKLSQLGAGGIGQIAAPAASTEPFPTKAPDPPSTPASPPPRTEGSLAVQTEESAPELAPEVPPEPTQIELTEDNARENWGAIGERAGRHALNLGLQLHSATPTAVAGDVVQLRFPAERADSQAYIEQADNREIIESVLREFTSNVRTFETYRVGAAPATEAPAPEPGTIPFGGMASREAARAAMENPDIAQVLDVFRGRIVDVRKNLPTPPPESTSEDA